MRISFDQAIFVVLLISLIVAAMRGAHRWAVRSSAETTTIVSLYSGRPVDPSAPLTAHDREVIQEIVERRGLPGQMVGIVVGFLTAIALTVILPLLSEGAAPH